MYAEAAVQMSVEKNLFDKVEKISIKNVCSRFQNWRTLTSLQQESVNDTLQEIFCIFPNTILWNCKQLPDEIP